MNQLLNKLPFLNRIVVLVKRKLLPRIEFTTTEEYWVNRYKVGGDSGAGSYNNLAEFKGDILNEFVLENNITTVIELGCGDGNQLKYCNYPSYIGFDISSTAIETCNAKFKEDNSKQFFHMNQISNQKADLLLSLDVLYHLVEDETFNAYMNQLFEMTKKYVIIYSIDSEETTYNGPHVKSRKFTNWIKENRSEFKMVKHIPNKFPYKKGKGSTTSIADFYFFEKDN